MKKIPKLRGKRPLQSCLVFSLLCFFSFSPVFAGISKLRIPAITTLVTIQGKITDASGEELPGVSVLVKGTLKGTSSDNSGNFSVENVKPEDVLVFSFVGYVSTEIKVGNQTTINVQLKQNEQLLDEVVVVGYGTVAKKDLTGSVSSVDTKDLKGIPNSRVDQLLQGRTAGVQITSSNGSPGAGTVIRVRGGNSIVGDNEPLFVIDGIIVGQSFDLNNINTNDIKSIEILKDASSIAIYGSRGANGVVLVTTKGGRKYGGGKPEVSIGANLGVQDIIRNPQLLNGPEHVAYTNEDARFRKLAEPFPNTENLPNTDWVGLLTGPAAIYNLDASVGGSSEKGDVNYYLSGNYFNQDGIVKSSGIEKYIFRTNLDIQLNAKLKAGVRLNFSRLNRDNGVVSYGGLLGQLPERAVFDENGEYTGLNPITASIANNPVASAALNTDQSITSNLLGTVYLEYAPSKNWLVRTTFNPEVNNVKTNIFESSQSPDFKAVGDKGRATINTLSSIGWNNENTVQYTKTLFGNHRMTLLGGASLQKYTAESTNLQAFGIASDATKFNNLGIGADPTRNIIGTGFDAFQIVSFFGRANYVINDKYLFTLVGRSDGSSRFAKGNKYAFFPSVAAAWKLSEEPFIKNLNIFQELKLRASYGNSGSQAIDSFRTLALIEEARTTYNGTPATGTTLGRPANENLRWETTAQLDVALEFSVFKGKLFTELNYYDKKTTDLLLNVRIPRQSGFVSQLQNLGKVQNRGLELLVTSTNVSRKNFNWTSTLTLSGNRNKVLDLGGVNSIDLFTATGQSGPSGRLIVGQPAPVYVGVDYLGTWKTQEAITASKQGGQILGGPHFDDPDGNGQITPDELYVIGSPQPDFIYGLQNNFKYRNFDFSFFLQGSQGNDVLNGRTINSYFVRGESQKYAEVVNRWTPENPTSDIPRTGYLGVVPSNSEMVEDGSFLRLKTARLGYSLQFDNSLVKSMNVYLSGTNLLLFSKFRLIDPEATQFSKTEPNGNVLLGYTDGQYPSARLVNIGFNLTF